MAHKIRRRRLLTATAVSLLFLGPVCSGVDERVGPTEPAPSPGSGGNSGVALVSLQTVDDCDTLLRRLKDAAASRVGPNGLVDGWGGWGVKERAGPDRPSTTSGDDMERSAAAPGSTGTTDHSGTNVQEAGVDEPDVVKTDGDTLFVARGAELVAVDADGPGGVLDRIDVAPPGSAPGHGNGGDIAPVELGGADLLLAGDRALVLSTSWSGVGLPESNPPKGSIEGPVTTLASVDVSDPSDLRTTDVVTVEGSYHTARLVDGTARVVLQSPGPQLDWQYPESWNKETESRRANLALIEATTLDDWLPHRIVEGRRDLLADCSQVYLPQAFAGAGLVTVLTAPLAGTGPIEPTAATLMATADTVYASASSLFIASHAWPDVGRTGRTGGDDTTPPSDVRTDLHRFDITGDTAVHTASGRVDGTVLNQFALSEHEGRLRVATTDPNWDAPVDDADSTSAVTVLEPQGSALVAVGSVGDLGRGETIRSVRFVGATAYVVTFRQTDPFYVVDLRDPTAPRVAGELKLPGYSGYLHPIDAIHVLGVGQEADADGTITGVKVSLFDVADPARPTEVGQWVTPGGSQSVELDAHAFLWWPATKLAVVPIEAWDGGDGAPASSGAVGLTVDGSVREVGRITHADRAEWAPVQRSVVVGDVLWTLSPAGLLSSDLATLASGPFVPFA